MKPPTLTPDSARYLTSRTPPSPFHLRPLLPWLCGQSATRWYLATWIGTALLALGTYLLKPGWQGIAAAALVLALPSVRFNLTHVVLVDMAALGLATASASLMVHGWIIPAIILALGAPSIQLAATLTAGYAQLLVATDTVRLYQWSAPVVAIAATSAVDPRWWPLMVIVTLFNPLRGDGV